jgi:hypothetical protein
MDIETIYSNPDTDKLMVYDDIFKLKQGDLV